MGPRWLVNRCKALGDMALTLATPGSDLYDRDTCHVHNVHRAIFSVNGHDGEVYAAMQDIFDYHNNWTVRDHGIPDEPWFRCLAIYGAAAQAVLELAEERFAGHDGRSDTAIDTDAQGQENPS